MSSAVPVTMISAPGWDIETSAVIVPSSPPAEMRANIAMLCSSGGIIETVSSPLSTSTTGPYRTLSSPAASGKVQVIAISGTVSVSPSRVGVASTVAPAAEPTSESMVQTSSGVTAAAGRAKGRIAAVVSRREIRVMGYYFLDGAQGPVGFRGRQ